MHFVTLVTTATGTKEYYPPSQLALNNCFSLNWWVTHLIQFDVT